MKLSKKHILLIISVFLLIISIIYRLLNPFEQQRVVGELTYTGKKVGKKADKIKTENQRDLLLVNKSDDKDIIAKFLNKPTISAKVHSDLFAIYKPPVKIDKNRKINAPVNKAVQNSQKIVNIKKDPVQEIKEYLSSYRLYGTYKSENIKAVFLAKNKLVLVAKTGDRLDGKYLIDDIQDNYIKIRALELNEIIHLDMREFNNE
jgi:hypothetical protein